LTNEINSSRLREILAKTVGPAPWQWKTFPAIHSSNGHRLVWSHHGEQGTLAYLITLNLEEEADKARLALNTYCRPFSMPPSRFGVWCPEGRSIRLACFDADELKPFDLAEIAGWFKQSSDRIYAVSPPIAELEVPLALEAGMHKIEVPEELRSLDEMIVPTSYPAGSNDDPAFALYIFYLQAGLVEVLPQKWFTKSQYEIGKQWITKVARDPESHRIFGECFGVGNFLLEEDGCRLERWIDKTPPR
jgi:hypothetical protein